jgi:[acyl-carrier-protein] S-malonyltransferase
MAATSTTIVFPGQGTQRAGMGRDFYDWSSEARATYDEASAALGLDLCALCFGDDERLGLTEYAQPAILTTEIAMHRAVVAQLGLDAASFGGHSLGEYTALVAAGVMPLDDAVRLVHERGRLMQEAVPVGRGGMTAVIGEALDRDAIAGALAGLQVGIANDNSGTQIVLSGLATDLTLARERIATALGSAVRFVDLEVSAPFHSPLMAGIEPTFADLLERTRANLDASRATLVTSNYSGSFHEADDDALIERLVRQISGTVRWRSNMEALAAPGTRVIEIGPGRPLRAFFKTLGVEVQTITDVRSASRVALAVLER